MDKGGIRAERASLADMREAKAFDRTDVKNSIDQLLLEISRDQDYASNLALQQKEKRKFEETGIQDIVTWAKEFCDIDITPDIYGFPSYGCDQAGQAVMYVGAYNGLETIGWLLHELGHWITSTPANRNRTNYGLDVRPDEETGSLTPEQDARMLELYLLFKSGHKSRNILEPRMTELIRVIYERDPSLAFTGFTTEFSGRDRHISILRRIPETLSKSIT